VILSSWFIALAVFALVFVAGTAIGSAWSGAGPSAEPGATLAKHDHSMNTLHAPSRSAASASSAHKATLRSAKGPRASVKKPAPKLTKAQRVAEKKAATQKELAAWYDSMAEATADPAATLGGGKGPKKVPSVGDRPERAAMGRAVPPQRITKTAALETWNSEVEAQMQRASAKEKSARNTIYESLKALKANRKAVPEATKTAEPKPFTQAAEAKAKLESWYDAQPDAMKARVAAGKAAKLGSASSKKAAASKKAVASEGHSYTPVVKPHTMHVDSSAPTTMELGVRSFLRGFEGMSTVELLARAHVNLERVERFEILAHDVDPAMNPDLAENAEDLDALPEPSASDSGTAADVAKQIFGTETRAHPWERDQTNPFETPITRPGFLGDKKTSAKTSPKSSSAARKLLGGGPGTGTKSATQFADEVGAALDLSTEDTLGLLPDIADSAPSVVDGVSKKEGPEVTDATRAMAAALDLLAVASRAAPAPIGKDQANVFKPAWAALMEVLPVAGADEFRKACGSGR
jgi:hypothetical protein